MANAGIGIGDTINLEGNPLSIWTLCSEVVYLEAQGVTVLASETCDDDPESTGSQDGDAFSNAEELRYLQFFYSDPEFIDIMFRWYIMFDSLPNVDPSCYSIDQQGALTWLFETDPVTVQVGGNGSVYLGDGDITGDNTKTWNFAKYAPDCSSLCNDPETCGHNTIYLDAIPDADWLFYRWITPDGEVATPALSMEITQPSFARAEFLYRPGVMDLDLSSDLNSFLLEIGYLTTSMAPELYMYDRGDTGVGLDTQGDPVIELGPNGIPDAAELLALQVMLKNAQFNNVLRGGGAHVHVWNSWEKNLETATNQINNSSLEYLARLVASYMTLGVPGHQVAMEKLVEEHYSITLNRAAYDTSASCWFGSHGDADGDGVWNIEEWENVERDLGSTATPAELAEEAATASSDPDDTHKPDPPAPGTFTINGQTITVGSAAHQALIAEATGIPTTSATGTITFTNTPHLAVNAYVIDPPGNEETPMRVGEPLTCKLGTRFRIIVTGQTDWFLKWSVPETVIDGSIEQTDEFVFGRSSQTVTPVEKSFHGVHLENPYIEWQATGPLASAAFKAGSIVYFPQDTYVKVSVMDTAPEPYNSYEVQVDDEITCLRSVTVEGGDIGLSQDDLLSGQALWYHGLSDSPGAKLFGLSDGDMGNGHICGAISGGGPWGDGEGFQRDFLVHIYARHGYQLETITQPLYSDCADQIISMLLAGVRPTCTMETGAGSTSVTVVKNTHLNVQCETIPWGVGGYVTASQRLFTNVSVTDPIQKYHARVTECVHDTELIRLTAVPQVNCAFFGWREEGSAGPVYDEDGNVKDTGSLSLGAGADNSCYWIRDATIYIKCPVDRTLVAVFFDPYADPANHNDNGVG